MGSYFGVYILAHKFDIRKRIIYTLFMTMFYTFGTILAILMIPIAIWAKSGEKNSK
jgi:hypothetical protein